MTVDVSTFVMLALVFMGIALRHRKTSKDTDQFHTAGWSATKFAIVASIVALFGAGELSTFTEYYTYFGSGIIFFFLGVSVGFLYIALDANRFHREITSLRSPSKSFEKAYQINDTVRDRYGVPTGVLFTVLATVAVIVLFLIQVRVGSLLISVGSGISYEVAVIGVVLFVAIYVVLSGLDGIYSTDKVQVLALMIGLVLITERAVRVSDIDVMGEFSKVFQSIDIVTFLLLFFPGFFAVIGTSDVHLRAISAKTGEDLRHISFASAGGWFLLGLILVVFSAGIVNYPTNDDTPAFIHFLSDAEGSLRVVVIVSLVCALLSTADTEAHVAALLVNRCIRPQTKPSVNLSRILIVVICALGGLIAILFKEHATLTTLYTFLLNISVILGPFVIAMVLQRGTAAVAAVSLSASTLLLLYYITSDIAYGTGYMTSLWFLTLAIPTSVNILVECKHE